MIRYLYSVLFSFLLVSAVSAQTGVGAQGLTFKYMVHTPETKYVRAPLVVLLHGYGSNERDLFELRGFFPKDFIVVAPRAPYPVSSDGFQWFEKELVDGKYSGKKEQLEKSRARILKFISEVVDRHGADPQKVYVIGFSQGAIMSYEVGLANPDKVVGIGVLSGVLPESLKPSIKRSQALSKLKIFVAHGTADNILPYANGKDAVDYLSAQGLKPEFHSYKGMKHSISPSVMSDLINWL